MLCLFSLIVAAIWEKTPFIYQVLISEAQQDITAGRCEYTDFSINRHLLSFCLCFSRWIFF